MKTLNNMIETLNNIIEIEFFQIGKYSLTVGILSPGEMGSAIAYYMVRAGIRVISALDDRSERTKLLAKNVNIELE